MADTGFEVPAASRGRFTSYYRTSPAGGLELADAPDGQWSIPPAFPLGNGGLAGTADGWLALAGCCWPKASPPTAGGCCRPSRCG